MTYLKIINLKTISVNLGPGSDHLKCELNLISYKSTQDSQRRHWGGGGVRTAPGDTIHPNEGKGKGKRGFV